MATKYKAASVYIPADIEERLVKYCFEHEITRTYKSGAVKPSISTGIIEILKVFLSSNNPPSPLTLNSFTTVTNNLVTEEQLNEAVNSLKDELLRDQSVTVSEVSSGVAINNEQIEELRSQIKQQIEQLRSHLSEFSINLNLPKDSSSEEQENEEQ
ncbi:MAG: hypothetical protein QNJ54_28690 [Prochloraceae cyanobacterium]|nr:hypothetical protein [Prochloraceae cyanobacterium]